MFAVVLSALLIASADGLGFLDEKIDCRVTFWSEWSMSSVWQATSKHRTRQILRYPLNGGQACPELEEVQNIGKEERLELTATKMVESFLSPRSSSRQNGYGRDLLVIVDSSGSISKAEFEIAKEELARLLGSFCPKYDPFSRDINVHQAALIRYSSTPVEIFDFNTNRNTAELQKRIREMNYTGGRTCTGDAFNYALTDVLKPSKGMRIEPDVKQEILILTDGQSNCGRDAVEEAIKLQHANIDVFGLMIGIFSDSGRGELQQYVSDVESHLFNVENFHDLTKLIDFVEMWLQLAPCTDFELNK